MVINNSLFNGNALNALYGLQNSLASNFEKLSSGKQINKGSDDPAGLVITQQMRAEIAGLEQEIQSLENYSSKLTVTDGYLGSLSDKLQDMRSNALAAANEGGVDESQKAALDAAVRSSVSSYNELVEDAAFGKQALLDGSEGSEVDISKLEQLDLSTPEKAAEAVEKIDAAIEEVNNARAEVGATQANEVDAQIRNLQTTVQNLNGARSVIEDTDYAKEYSSMVANEILLQTTMAMIGQGNILGAMATSMLK
ncbi:MAG: hypothetical protein GF307_01005 [candidate division Zixibacteria bacterium]|nr:hypothetical protein [candidate division Zixibacteria bacterium]